MTKEQINAIAELENSNLALPQEGTIKNFCEYWPVIKRILGLAKIVTGTRGDQAIDAIINWGDRICSGNIG